MTDSTLVSPASKGESRLSYAASSGVISSTPSFLSSFPLAISSSLLPSFLPWIRFRLAPLLSHSHPLTPPHGRGRPNKIRGTVGERGDAEKGPSSSDLPLGHKRRLEDLGMKWEKERKKRSGRGGSSSSSSFSQQKKIPLPPSHQSCSSAGHEFYIRRNCVGLSRLRQTLFFPAAFLRAHAGRKIPFSLITGRKRLRQSQGRKEGRKKNHQPGIRKGHLF